MHRSNDAHWNHLIGAAEQRAGRHDKAGRLRRLEVDNRLKLLDIVGLQ
jgi:hypothetical protein